MSIIDKLNNQGIWSSFVATKIASGNMNKCQIEDMLAFVRNKEYIPIVNMIKRRENFIPPSKVIISKQFSSKKGRFIFIPERKIMFLSY